MLPFHPFLDEAVGLRRAEVNRLLPAIPLTEAGAPRASYYSAEEDFSEFYVYGKSIPLNATEELTRVPRASLVV